LLRRFAADDKAVAVVEAAVVMPFVLVLGMGIIEFGWLMSQIGNVQTALRDSVRFVSRSSLVIASNGTASLQPSVTTDARSMMSGAYQRNGITSFASLSLVLTPVTNTNGSLYRGGTNVYRITGSTDFTPASAGLLTLVNVTLPRINLHYEARHVGG
jgi:hypothetical protein